MEFRDLKAQYKEHKIEIDRAIEAVIDSTAFVGGGEVRKLEELLAEYVGVKHCISCANGTDALELALMTWNIGQGDAVFVPDFTFFSSREVVSTVGATPIFVDVDEETFNISVESLQNAIEYVNRETSLVPKVVIAVDLFGQPAEYVKIKKLVSEFGLLLLEDGAQGFGGRIGYKKSCSFGDISTTSFFPAKPLGCYGDGGAIFTDNDDWAELIRSYKVHGKGIDKYDNIRIGRNSRLDTLQAAVLIEKLNFFDKEIEICNKLANLYNNFLSGVGGISIPSVPEGYYSSWAQYTILLDNEGIRDKIISALKEAGIPSMIYYKKPMHLQEAFWGAQPEKLSCKVTEELCKRCLSLPMSAYVNKDEIEKIAFIIRKNLNECS